MATQKGKDAFAFVKEFLNKNKKASFAEVRDAGKAAGHKIYPIVYGRAQLLLGHVTAGKKSPAGTGGKRAAKSATKKTGKKTARQAVQSMSAPVIGKRGPGRPPKAAASSGLGGLDALIQHVRGLERERDQLRSTIEKLRSILGSV